MRPRRNQKGFILSIEAILVITILCAGILVGIVAIRDALLIRNAYRDLTRFVVLDSSTPPVVIGQVVGFDQYDTPLVPFVDYDYAAAPEDYPNYRTLIGIRPMRFTSRQPVFYTEAGCPSPDSNPGNVCLARPESATARTLLEAAGIIDIGATSYLSSMQKGPGVEPGPLYGIGADRQDPDGRAIGGVLYRSRDDGSTCAGQEIASVWYSQEPASLSANICFDIPEDDIQPADDSFLLAEPVALGGSNELVLDALIPPFRLNPAINPAAIEFTPPCAEGDTDCVTED